MSGELLDDEALQPFQGEEIRKTVAQKVKHLRTEFKLIPLQIQKFNIEQSKKLKFMWDEENKLLRKEKKRETPKQRLIRWKDISRRYRHYSLIEASNQFYGILRRLRGDIALIVAMYQFSEIDRIPSQQMKWKANTFHKMGSLVLRMKGPTKPTKKKFGLRDLKYDIGEAYLEMMKPLEKWAEDSKKYIYKMVAPKKKIKYETKVKRFREAVVAREYLTILCQSLAPRSDGLKLQTLIQSESADDIWVQVFGDSESISS